MLGSAGLAKPAELYPGWVDTHSFSPGEKTMDVLISRRL